MPRALLQLFQVCVDIDNIHLYSAKLPTSAPDLSIDDKPILHDTTFNVCIEQRQVLLCDKVVTRRGTHCFIGVADSGQLTPYLKIVVFHLSKNTFNFKLS